LVSELEPTVTGIEFLEQIINVLSALLPDNEIKNIVNTLKEISAELSSLKKSSIGRPVSVYEKISEKLKRFDTKFDIKYLFQTDMVKQSENCLLSEDVVNDILQGIEILNRLTLKNSENNLSKFRNAFSKRFEDEEIPLLYALDTETGIGYLQNNTGDVSPLVDDLFLQDKNNEISKIEWNSRWAFLHQRYIETVSEGNVVLELTEKDIEGFNFNWDDLPETIAALVKIIQTDENGNYQIYLKSVGGSSAANLIGRFCHADNNVNKFVTEIIEKDERQNKDYIFAEIVHLPESRIGNILSRPTLRTYEIPYLAKSSVNKDKQIPLSDLYISVRGENIFLRSKRFNNLVIPRLTTAHNYSFNALPVYQFLCDMQTQNLIGGLSFNWGPLASQYTFLPRVTYKNIILSRATWHINTTALKTIFHSKDTGKQMDNFITLARKINLPDEFLLIDNDNELYVNINNETSLKILLNQIKKRSSCELAEFIFSEDNLIVTGIDGNYTNEFIITFYKNKMANP